MNKPSQLLTLKQNGQSIWLDYIERRLLEDGTLHRLIDEDGLAGMTSNPAIFEKAIVHTDDYTTAIREMAQQDAAAEEVYEHLAIDDVKQAAQLFNPVFEQTNGVDGYVSLEVSPLLAYDTATSLSEAQRLWKLLGQRNVMIKVPGTKQGLPAIRQLISEGININVTLLFSVKRYLEVIDAYMGGLEDRLAAGKPIDHIASVASFFLSRIDAKTDPLLDEISTGDNPGKAELAQNLRGQVAIASAGFAYHHYQEHYASARWRRLEAQGAKRQRLLWASTGTKDPSYSDIKYVEGLIGQETVNTLPLETLSAYRDHGKPQPRLLDAVAEAPAVLQQLTEVGIDLDEIETALEQEGVRKFVEPFNKLLQTLDSKVKNPN